MTTRIQVEVDLEIAHRRADGRRGFSKPADVDKHSLSFRIAEFSGLYLDVYR